MAGPQYTDREQNAKAPPVSSPTEAEASSEQLLRYLLQLQTGEVDASDSDPVAIQAPIEAVAELDPDTTEQEFSFASEGGGSLPVKDIGGNTYVDIRALSRLTVTARTSGTETTLNVYARITESTEESELVTDFDTSVQTADYGTTYELLDNLDALNIGWVRVTETGAADTANTITSTILAA